MLRARKLGVLTPCVLCVEHEASTIYFERVTGMPVKQALQDGELQPEGAPGAARALPQWLLRSPALFVPGSVAEPAARLRCAAFSRWQLQHALQATGTQVKHDVHACLARRRPLQVLPSGVLVTPAPAASSLEGCLGMLQCMPSGMLCLAEPCASVGTQPHAICCKCSRMSEVPARCLCSAHGAAAGDRARSGGAARRRRGARRPHHLQPARAGGRQRAGRAGRTTHATLMCCAMRRPCCASCRLRGSFELMAKSPAPPRHSPRRSSLYSARCAAQVVIDFGLSSNSTIAEDKAVDLYVLERSFTSAHASCGPLVRPAPGSAGSCMQCWACVARRSLVLSPAAKTLCQVWAAASAVGVGVAADLGSQGVFS